MATVSSNYFYTLKTQCTIKKIDCEFGKEEGDVCGKEKMKRGK